MEVHSNVVQDPRGNGIAGAEVRVLDSAAELATIYLADGVTILANPFNTDTYGRLKFSAVNGHYVVRVTHANFNGGVPYDTPIVLNDLDVDVIGAAAEAVASAAAALVSEGAASASAAAALVSENNAAASAAEALAQANAATATTASGGSVLATPNAVAVRDANGDLAGDILGSAAKVGVLKFKVMDIDDWDMNFTSSQGIPHGLDGTKIKFAYAAIRRSGDDLVKSLEESGTVMWGSTVILLSRNAAGAFDNVAYETTPYNRGWVTIGYID